MNQAPHYPRTKIMPEAGIGPQDEPLSPWESGEAVVLSGFALLAFGILLAALGLVRFG